MDFFSIIDKLRSNRPLSDEELTGLLAWLETQEGRESFFRDARQRWESFGGSDATADYESLLGALNSRIDASAERRKTKNRKGVRRLVWVAEAAAAVALVAGFWAVSRERHDVERLAETIERVEVYNPKGLRTTITLPDRSVVTLNADSRIAYPANFAGAERRVTLTGEAFFDVQKDRRKPFVVETASATMTVLGTSFNVRAYENEKYVSASLVEGSLRVDDGSSRNLLEPGEQIDIDRASRRSTVGGFREDDVTGWMEGKLTFQSLSFAEIATILERTFNVRIEIADPGLVNRTFTGRFGNGENLGQILEVLKLSADFTQTYDKDNNLITIE